MSNERRYFISCLVILVLFSIIALVALIAATHSDGGEHNITPTMQREFKSISPADKNTCMAYTLEVFSTPDSTYSLTISPPLDDNGENEYFNITIYDVDNDVSYTVRLPQHDIVSPLREGHYIVAVTNQTGAPMASTVGHLSIREGSHFRLSFVNVWCDDILPELDISA